MHPMTRAVPQHAADATDEGLMRQLAQGDEVALHTLYTRHRAHVYTLAYRITTDRMTAEEVTQDVFHGVWQAAEDFQAERPFLPWLTGIAFHRAIDATRSGRYRARHREEQLATLEATSPAEGGRVFEHLLLRVALDDALRALPALQRQALELAYDTGLTHAQIAAGLQQPLGTIKTRIHYGLVRLRSALPHEEMLWA